MTDTLREARIAEAKQWAMDMFPDYTVTARLDQAMHRLAVLIEQDWRPEPEVDAVTLAAREWLLVNLHWHPDALDAGSGDGSQCADAFRAGHAHALANCADVRRMDWLEGQQIQVCSPLVHGSRFLFDAHPDDSFEGEEGPSDLRTKIDRAMESGQ